MAIDPEFRKLQAEVRAATTALAIPDEDVEVASRSQRKRSRATGSALMKVTLVEEDGVLRWVPGRAETEVRGPRRARLARRRRIRGPEADGREVHSIDFERIAPSEVTRHLENLDQKLTPARGLRRWRDGRLVPIEPGEVAANAGARVLLVVHGTFSKCEAITEQLAKAPGGPALFQFLAGRYDQILTFDHPTLAVSPLLNAWDLHHHLARSAATFDVIAHSRGGLVARAWADGFRGGRGIGKLILVGSPLAGTSLAAPPRMKEAMNFISNVGKAVGAMMKLGGANPFFLLGAGLSQIVASFTAGLARTPILDAAVAIVPGLAAQSRVGNAPELLAMRRARTLAPNAYYAVRADFEPPAVGWKFWNLFVKPRQRLADFGADLLFPGANDLVVDHESIVSLANALEIPKDQVLEFDRQPDVHHCNYFEQRKTVEKLEAWLRRA